MFIYDKHRFKKLTINTKPNTTESYLFIVQRISYLTTGRHGKLVTNSLKQANVYCQTIW